MIKQYMQLTGRNCKLYFRDRGAVFFSLLSMFILLLLMGVFLGNMNVESVTDLLEEYGGIRDVTVDKENATHLVQYWILAGILVTNAVMVTMTVMTTMVKDRAEKKLSSFRCTPVSGLVLAFSYITAAVLMGMILCMAAVGIALLYIAGTGGEVLTFSAVGKLLGCIFLNVMIFAIIMYLAATIVASSAAWSGLGTIIGTLVGFVGAVYLPMGMLPDKVAAVLKYIPVLHGTSLMRQICCESILEQTFAGMPAEVMAEYEEAMGITVVMNETVLSSNFQAVFLLICGIIALGLMIAVTQRRHLRAVNNGS